MVGRIVLSVAACTLFPFAASAQLEPSVFGGVAVAELKRELMSVGPGGGQTTWRELRRNGHRVGWTAGVAARWSPVERVFLVGEAALTSKGFESESEGMNALHVEFPILVELVPFRIGGVGVALQGGVAWSREIACTASEVPGPIPGEATPAEPPGRREVGCDGYRAGLHDRSAVFGASIGPFAVLGADVTPEVRMVTGRMESQVVSYWYRARNRGLAFRARVRLD